MKMEKRYQKLKLTLVALSLFLGLMAMVQIPWFSPSLQSWIGDNIDRPMAELPLTLDGSVDFFVIGNARLSQNVLPEDNFVVDLVSVFGTEFVGDRDELLKKLSIESAPTTSNWIDYENLAADCTGWNHLVWSAKPWLATRFAVYPEPDLQVLKTQRAKRQEMAIQFLFCTASGDGSYVCSTCYFN